MEQLEGLEKFMRLLHGVRKIKRADKHPNETTRINTAEHTFEVALACWYIAGTNNLALNFEKILKYALAHDIIEGYAGDTPMFDTEAQKTKASREIAALERVSEEFPEFPDLIETIHEYESRKTSEARFVYAVDKLVDPVNAGMEEILSIWKEVGMSRETLVNYKKDKIAQSEIVVPYWNALLEKLDSKKEFFFD